MTYSKSPLVTSLGIYTLRSLHINKKLVYLTNTRTQIQNKKKRINKKDGLVSIFE